MLEIIELANKDINESVFIDAAFFKLAEGGAMGEPGGVDVISKTGKWYHFNYVFGDADMAKVEKLFSPLTECEFGLFGYNSVAPKGWNYVNLGMGNHLIVEDSVFEAFKEEIKECKSPPETYGKWMEAADSVISGSLK